ncbi:MAG TPA: hypothetical protein VHC22_20430 [Pirellulales bacterium]|nr:hypothetical protein [Pirellulales bacterium]
MRLSLSVGLLTFATALGSTDVASAVMGIPTLEDVPRLVTLTNTTKLRLDAISFFGVSLLVIAWAIQWVWNSVAKDFPRLPRISYLRSLGLMGLWGLLFLLVLTMISGARELMTPGAWKKQHSTHQLRDPPVAASTRPVHADAVSQENAEPASQPRETR